MGAQLKKNQEMFKKNCNQFWQKNEGVICDAGNFVGPKSSLHPCYLSRKKMVSVSFVSFENYELKLRKNFSTFFSASLLPKKAKYEKKIDVNFGPKCSL